VLEGKKEEKKGQNLVKKSPGRRKKTREKFPGRKEGKKRPKCWRHAQKGVQAPGINSDGGKRD